MRAKFAISDLPKDVPALVDRLQDIFRLLDLYLKLEPILGSQFQHYEIVLSSAVTGYQFVHNLGFIPTDIIQTFLTDGVTLTWSYANFDRTKLQFTTSAPCTVRFFAGRYQKETGVL